MRPATHRARRRCAAVAAVPVLLAAVLVGAASAPGRAAPADPSMPVPGDLSTTTLDDSTVSIPVPDGVTPTAITAVVTQPEVIDGGSVQFSVNGTTALSAPSSLYQKVTIPVTGADVIADRTIGLSVASLAAPVAGQACTPVDGTAAVRKVALEYTGTETAPTSAGSFFGPSSAGVDVVIPADADSQMIEAGLTAVGALAQRYDDKTPISMTTSAPDAATAVASQRVVALVAGRAGEVTTAVSTTGGIPMLTLTGTGQELVDAARSLSSDDMLLAGSDGQDVSTQMKARSTATERTLKGLGVTTLTLSGYGTVTQRFRVTQDDFGSPVSALRLHLEGSHTAFADSAAARLDVRVNDALVGSTTLGDGSGLDLDVTVPAARLRSVNDVDVTLTSLSPTGIACTPPSAPQAEVDIDTGDSTVTATRGTGDAEGFQLYPQVFQGTVPLAIASTGKQRVQSAIDAADLVVALQRAAAAPLDIQVVTPDAFLADDRSGIMVGAVAQDSINLDAPLELSSTRRLDRADSRFAVTSQDPYAALESIDQGSRFVLMLGSWAPGNGSASGSLSRKVVDAVVAQGWSSLDGDLVIADDAIPAFTAASRSLKPHVEETEQRSYAAWFVGAIVVLLLLLAVQVVVSIRRDRAVARAQREAEAEEFRHGPAYVEDEEAATDDLGDLDDLQVTRSDGRPRTSEVEAEAEAEVEPDAEPDAAPEAEPDPETTAEPDPEGAREKD